MHVITQINLKNNEFMSTVLREGDPYANFVELITQHCVIKYGITPEIDAHIEMATYIISHDSHLSVKIRDSEEVYVILYRNIKSRGLFFNTYKETAVNLFHLRFLDNRESVVTLEYVNVS
jgi:hypothetical protein